MGAPPPLTPNFPTNFTHGLSSYNNTMKPDFIGIGAIKTGSTSLYHYLNQHPAIHMARVSPIRELDFFIQEKNWSRGVDWYFSYFQNPEKTQGEISGEYTQFPRFEGVPERMHHIVPEARLIYLVRDPIERIVSEINHRAYALGHLSGDEISFRMDGQTLANSKYFMQLSRFLDYYPLERVHILTSEELKARPVETIAALFDFLGVEPGKAGSIETRIHHESKAKKEKNALGRFLSANFKGNHVKEWLQQRTPGWLDSLYHRLSRNDKPVQKVVLEPELVDALKVALKEDIDRVRELSGLPRAHWSV